MSRIEALLFSTGGASQGQRVHLELRSRSLVLHEDSGPDIEVAYAALTPRLGGWNGAALLFDWWDEAGTRTLSVHDAALDALRAAAPEALRERLGPHARRRRRNGPWRAFVLLAVGVLALGAVPCVVFISDSDRLVSVVVERIPPAIEARLGALTVESLAQRRVPAGLATRTLEDLGQRLAAQTASPYTFHWILVDDPQVNAMAAPGGSVVVFSGLMRAAESPEELAGVLAHEVQHVVLRHSLRGMVRDLGWRAMLGIVFSGAGDWGGSAATWAAQLGNLRFSRQQEAEADAGGVRLLERAAIDPQGLATFFARLSRDEQQIPAFLSTHPASEERAQKVRAMLVGAPAAAPLPYDWRAVREELNDRAGTKAGD